MSGSNDPRRFQRAYRNEVARLFRDCCREAYRTQRLRGVRVTSRHGQGRNGGALRRYEF